MTTDIILVRFGLPEMEDNCIRSVKAHTDDYTLTVHDNFTAKENLGKLWNRLIKESKSEFICLLNTDTLVEPLWLANLLDVFTDERNVGVVGPTTNSSHNEQSRQQRAKSYTVENFSNYKGTLSGFCMVFPKSVWKEVKGFPEDFGFYGQENAFISKILKAGYKQMWRKDVFVFHLGSMSAKMATRRGEMNEAEERRLGREKYQEFLSKL